MNLAQTIEAARNVLRFKHMAVKTDLPARRDMMQVWADYLDAIEADAIAEASAADDPKPKKAARASA